MRGQMVEYLVLNKLLDPFQSRFKANHSTTTALHKGHKVKCGSVLTLLEFSKAFDSIDHGLLLI
jgi:hypothetical protein